LAVRHRARRDFARLAIKLEEVKPRARLAGADAFGESIFAKVKGGRA
jgi:hypothetical protein